MPLSIARVFCQVFVVLLLLISGAVRAEEAATTPPPGMVGPAEVKLRDQAMLHLPAGFIFVPRPQADEIMKQWGNSVDGRFLGLILPQQEEDWAIVADW